MAIDSINFNNNYAYLSSLMTAGQVQSAQPAATMAETAVSPDFSSFLQQAMGETVLTDAGTKAAGIDLLLGGEQDLHSVLIASQKADVLLNLTVQIRNKMVESYQEIMRMQV